MARRKVPVNFYVRPHKMQIPIAALTAFLSFFSAFAHANSICPEGWVSLETTESKRKICLDLKQKVKNGELHQIKVVSRWSAAQTVDDGTIKFLSVLQEVISNCENWRAAIKSMKFFTKGRGNGIPLKSMNFGTEQLVWAKRSVAQSVS